MQVGLPVTLLIVVFTLLTGASAANAQGLEGRTIRYTTGPIITRGWEAELVKGTPNLGRYYWNPITSMGQAYKKIPSTVALKPGSIYVKPVQVPLPLAHRTPIEARANRQLQTSARLTSNQVQASVSLPQTIATYQAQPSCLKRSTSLTLSSAEVQGRLLK